MQMQHVYEWHMTQAGGDKVWVERWLDNQVECNGGRYADVAAALRARFGGRAKQMPLFELQVVYYD